MHKQEDVQGKSTLDAVLSVMIVATSFSMHKLDPTGIENNVLEAKML
jgi:hypothetical protein